MNGAAKRMKVKQDKKKKHISNKEQTGDAQRQFFLSERRTTLMKAATSARENKDHLGLKSMDVQSLSMPIFAESGNNKNLEISPMFFAPQSNSVGASRQFDPSFDRPSILLKQGPKAPPLILAEISKPPNPSNIRFVDNGKDVTSQYFQESATFNVE